MMTANRRSGTSRSSSCGYVTKMTISPRKFRYVSQKAEDLPAADKRLPEHPRASDRATLRGKDVSLRCKIEYVTLLKSLSFISPSETRRRPDSRPRFCRQQRRQWQRWRRRHSLSPTCPDQNYVFHVKVQWKYMNRIECTEIANLHYLFKKSYFLHIVWPTSSPRAEQIISASNNMYFFWVEVRKEYLICIVSWCFFEIIVVIDNCETMKVLWIFNMIGCNMSKRLAPTN